MRTKRFIKAATLSVGLLAITGAPALATLADAPAASIDEKKHDAKAVEVIEASITALGGRDKLAKIKSMKQTGTISIPMAGIEGAIEMNIASPDKLLLNINIAMMGQTLQGVNGDIAWSTDAMNGPRLMSDEESKELKKEANLQAALDYDKLNSVIEYVGEVEFEGQAADKIRLVDLDGGESFEFYSTDSHLQIGSETEAATPMGKIKAITVLKDYKELGGYLTATTVEQKAGATTVLFTFSDVEYNKLDDSVFDLPETIQTLVEASKEDKDD